MEAITKTLLIIHVAAGTISLLVAPIAMIVKKGGRSHAIWGLIFFWAMTVIFVTALFLSSVKWMPFLLMIAVFSYYSVFSGYRWKFLKKLYNDSQQPKWFDWLAMLVNFAFNLSFLAWGAYLIVNGTIGAFPFLALGFGFIGVRMSIKNYRLFKSRHHAKTWLFEHIGGMVGGFIATVTAFSAQMMDFMPAWLQWSWPSIIGIPLISYWIATYRKKYKVKVA
ncbi:MAG: hypothetical protein AAGG59_09915 [Bacteroidota bacterium]